MMPAQAPEYRLTPEEHQEIDRLVELLDNNKFCWEISTLAIEARCSALDISYEAVFSELIIRGWRLDLFGLILIKTAAMPLEGDTGQGLPPAVSPPDYILDHLYGILPDPSVATSTKVPVNLKHRDFINLITEV